MTSVVIVSTVAARRLCQELEGGSFNMNPRRRWAQYGHAAARRAGAVASTVLRRDDAHAWAAPRPEGATGRQHRAPDCAEGWPAHHGIGRHRQPLLLVGPADHLGHGSAAHHCARPMMFVAGGVESISWRSREMNLHYRSGDLAPAKQSPRSTGACCRPPSKWPSATTSAAKPWTNTAPPSQQRLAQPRPLACSDAGIAPITVTAGVADKTLGLITKPSHGEQGRRHARRHDGRSHQRLCARRCPVARFRPATPASSSDGAGACVVTQRRVRQQEGPQALGPLPRLLREGWTGDDSRLWFVPQVQELVSRGIGSRLELTDERRSESE